MKLFSFFFPLLALVLLCAQTPISSFPPGTFANNAGKGTAPIPPPLVATLTDHAENGSSLTTYDWSARAFAIGGADASRVMVIGIISRAAATPSVSSITACGGTPSLVNSILASGSVSRLTFYQIACPTGTTAGVSVTFGAAQLQAQAIVWSLTNNTGIPVSVPLSAQQASNAGATTTATTGSLTVNPNGVTLLIGHALNSGSPTITPTNYSAEAGFASPVVISSTTYSTAGRDTTAGSRAYTSVWSSGSTLATLLAASWSLPYVGPGDIVSGWSIWASPARAYSNAYALANGSLADLVDVGTGATAVCTLKASPTGAVDLSAYCPGSLTPSAACAAVTSCVVKKMYDQSGSGNHATQVTLSVMPGIIFNTLNGLPVLDYPGGVKSFNTTATFSTAQPYTMYGVQFRSSTNSTVSGGVIGGSGVWMGYSTTANQVEGFATTGVNIAANDNLWHAFQAVFNGASGNSTLNGGATTTRNYGSTNLSASVLTLGRASGVQCICRIAEVGVLLGTGINGTQASAIYQNIHGINGYNGTP